MTFSDGATGSKEGLFLILDSHTYLDMSDNTTTCLKTFISAGRYDDSVYRWLRGGSQAIRVVCGARPRRTGLPIWYVTHHIVHVFKKFSCLLDSRFQDLYDRSIVEIKTKSQLSRFSRRKNDLFPLF